MKRLILLGSVLITLLMFVNCRKDNLSQLPSLELERPRVEALDSLYLSARIIRSNQDDNSSNKPKRMGFILVDMAKKEVIEEKDGAPNDKGDKFTAVTKNLGFNKNIGVTAFIDIFHKYNNSYERLFSDTTIIQTNSIEFVSRISAFNVGEFKINTSLFGEIIESKIQELGHIWAIGKNEDSFNDTNFKLGNQQGKDSIPIYQQNYEHFFNIPLNSKVPYLFMRGYAIYRDSSVHGNIETIKLENFWEDLPTPPEKLGCRFDAVGFSDGKYGYIGLGNQIRDCTQATASKNYKRDFWRYNPLAETAAETWSEIKKFQGKGRAEAVVFKIKGRIFVGLGKKLESDETLLEYNDFYEFHPTEGDNGEWTEKDPFPDKRSSAVSFVINDKGYVGTGNSCTNCQCNDEGCYQMNFYSFDPYLGSKDRYEKPIGKWMPVIIPPGMDAPEPRIDAVSFTVDNKGYLSCGQGRKDHLSDLWEFNPASTTKIWEKKENLPARPREKAVSFHDENFGYVATGGFNPSESNAEIPNESDLWRYSPQTNEWIQLADVKSIRRWGGVSFSIEDQHYIGLGQIFEPTNSDRSWDTQFYRYIPLTPK